MFMFCAILTKRAFYSVSVLTCWSFQWRHCAFCEAESVFYNTLCDGDFKVVPGHAVTAFRTLDSQLKAFWISALDGA